MRLHCIHGITFCILLATACRADSTVSDDDFFNFIRADVKKAPVAPPPVKTPTEAEAMLEKWKNYEQTRTEKQKTDTTAGRKVLMEMLLKKSLTATPEARGALLAESERIKGLAPEAPLVMIEGANFNKMSAVLGKWIIKQVKGYHEIFPSGIDQAEGSPPAGWRWLDMEAVVLVSEEPKFWNLFWLEKPTGMVGISSSNQRFNMEKKVAPKAITPDTAVLNLNSAESTQRQALAAELGAQRQRVINWLLDKAKLMSADEMVQVVGKVHFLEIAGEEQSDSAAKLKGKWVWENQEITFQAGGVIANRNAQKVGRWAWLGRNKTSFAVIFKGAKATAKDIYVLKSPAEDSQTTFEAHQLNSGHISVTRKLP